VHAVENCSGTALIAVLAILGCGHGDGMVYAASPASSDRLRRPDAVVLEPPAAIPVPAGVASAGGVVALREPLPADAVTALVESFVDAWSREALDALVALLASDAGPLEARGRGKSVLVEGWRQRLHTHEYERLAGVEVVRPERIQSWSWDDLGAAAAGRTDVRPGELLVRAPVEVATVGGDRLFGDVLTMVLRLEDGKYKIVAYSETEGR
jgi:hypothetical protein